MKDELQNIISGKSPVRYGDAIQKISRYLREGQSPSRTLKTSKQIKIIFGLLQLILVLLFLPEQNKEYIFSISIR
ncbi:hypothetical protein [Elizabethkingia anophelis]|uniref:hypothetical protein n=1 Tax=Elizabethkingia anophelis TaxID=1117645 RepID=UPI00301E0464